MKIKDFDFRIWDNEYHRYLNDIHNSFENGEEEITKYFVGLDGTIGGYDGEGNCFDIDNQESLEIELYTGVKDSNGKGIYEGDILVLTNQYSKTNGVVKIHKEGTFYLDDKGYYQGSLANLAEEYNIKIVGNIHSK